MIASDLQHLASATPTQSGAAVRELESLNAEPTALEYLLAQNPGEGALRRRTLLFLLHRAYGDDASLAGGLRRLSSLGARFLELYGDGRVNLLRAPARINILGEHVDYVSYLPTASLPFGSREHDMLMLYRAEATGSVRGASTFEAYPPFAFALSEAPASSGVAGEEVESQWLTHLYESPAQAPHWGNYVKGAAYFARLKWGERARLGFDFVVDSGIPPGGGASSSSALVVLSSAAIREVNRIRYAPEELVRDAAKAEWYVGTRGGSMDHTAICLARRGHGVLIEYRAERTRLVPLPGSRFRWATFFSHPADKGRGVMIEYNERAAVSRLLIPAVIEGWRVERPERYSAWLRSIDALQTGSPAALDEIEELLEELPQTLTLAEVERDYREAYAGCARAFPALIAERRETPLEVRARALHHLGEVRRVNKAAHVLGGAEADASSQNERGEFQGSAEAAMRSLGGMLDESHASLRDLYGVSTPEVERLIEIVRTDPKVYGARLMGGGFGGNILALTTEENVSALVDRVEAEYYGPRNRRGVGEGSVMVSTPGDGLASLSVEEVWREATGEFSSLGGRATDVRERFAALLDEMTPDAPSDEVWPVIVAAGKGTRARASGLDVPKPLAPVLGTPAILRVLGNIRAAFDTTRTPVVIVSPETESEIRGALAGEEVSFVVQTEALGTGDAVLRAYEGMRDFRGRALVIWGTQPAVRPETIRRTFVLAALFDDYEMVLPTALTERPYAPLMRGERGRVVAARETHLEGAPRPVSGESNIGVFALGSESMFRALFDLKRRHWDEAAGRYRSTGGELGFPNEMINYLAGRERGVFACPIADRREGQGIKEFADIARCERFISEWGREER